jgi:predicted kinase
MPKIILERGLPASGKSTCSKQQVQKNKKKVRIGRDDLREMGFGLINWFPKREAWVDDCEIDMVRQAIQRGFTPIVDSTNLKEERLIKFQALADDLQVPLELCDHLDIPLTKLIERDEKRSGTARVGRAVIEKLGSQAGMFRTDREVVIVDVDGTLADCEKRTQFIKSDKPTDLDFHTFFMWVWADTPRLDVIQEVNKLAKKYEIWIVSGRPDFHVLDQDVVRVGEETVNWLEDNGVKFDHILMRKSGDRRPDTEVKKEILEKQILRNMEKSQIKLVIDDRPSVIRMWQEQGLEVKDVGKGVEF